MIGLAVRLGVASGREALVRTVMIAVAVAVGTTLLLATLAATNAVTRQNARYAWLLATESSFAPAAPGVDPMWASVSDDLYDGHEFTVVELAATGQNPPLPPGFTRVPGPGEFMLSPALAALVRSAPPAELGDRFPGRQIAVLSNDALPGPDALVAVVGRSVADLSTRPGAGEVTAINDLSPADCGACVASVGVDANGIALVLAVVALAMLFPILVFIGAATRLSAARREHRFAAMRLVGATHRQVAAMSTVESTAAAAVGAVLGLVGFALLRPAIATIPFSGERFFTADLQVRWWQVLVVLVGVPVVAALMARWAVRRVRISPLGIARRVTPTPPRPWGLLVLAGGLVELTYFLVGSKPESGPGQVAAYLPGFLLIMVGLVVAGPWLTMIGARLLVRRANRTTTLMAGSRLADNPSVGFRAVSGVVLALFVTTVAVGVMTTFSVHRGSAPADRALAGTVFQSAEYSDTSALTVTPALLARLRSDPGVRGISTLYSDPATPLSEGYQPLNGFARCSDLATTPGVGRCAGTTPVARVDVFAESDTEVAARRWPAASLSLAELSTLPVHTVVVATDGAAASIERVRTALEAANPAPVPPHTADEFASLSARELRQYEQLATVVVVTSLPIAGISLAVSVVAGLADRRRPFSLLRLAGTSSAVLRRVVALESVAPLLAGAVVAVVAGLGAAGLFTRAQLGYTLAPPGASYWLLVGLGMLVALLVVASTFPMIDRTTGPAVARND